MKRIVFGVFALIACCVPQLRAIPGDFDLTFNGTGRQTVLFNEFFEGMNAECYATAIQSDGKIVLAGSLNDSDMYHFAVARLLPDGSPDTSFNGTGKQVFDLQEGSYCEAYAVAIQSDGKIVVAGYTYESDSDEDQVAVARLNDDGSFDNTFGNGGKLIPVLNNYSSYGNALVVQPDGKLIVAGSTYTIEGEQWAQVFAVVRFNSDGSFDNTFNGTGIQTARFEGYYAEALAVALQSTGEVVVAGGINWNDSKFALVRLLSDGTFDLSFNGTGRQTVSFYNSDRAKAVALSPDGTIVVAGETYDGQNNRWAIARLLTHGQLDPNFNGTGTLVLAVFSDGYGEAAGVQVQPDGKPVVVGYWRIVDTSYFAVARLTTYGSLDTSFNTTGSKLFAFDGSTTDYPYAVALQSDGKIVVAGETYFNDAGSYLFAVARLLVEDVPPVPVVVPDMSFFSWLKTVYAEELGYAPNEMSAGFN